MERLNNVQGASNLIEKFTDKKTVFRSHDMICPSVCGIQLFTVSRIWRQSDAVCPYPSELEKKAWKEWLVGLN